MLKFMVFEDEKKFLEINCHIINKTMMNSNLDYKIFRYNEIPKGIEKTINNEGPKIYIIDIDLNGESGINLIRKIRENDVISPIIVASAHHSLESTILKARLFILDFIYKLDEYELNLKKSIDLALKALGKRKILTFKKEGYLEAIDMQDIVYIIKENMENKCKIKTKQKEFLVNSSLTSLKQKLTEEFIQSHRCCVINKQHICQIDYKKAIISFKNGDVLNNMISKNYKKELKNLWQ